MCGETHLPGNITLRDPWFYPDQGADRFRRRAWALLSSVGSQIHLPDTLDSVFLKCINVDYEPDSITLEISKASDSTETESLPFPEILQSDDGAFEKWLREAKVPPYTLAP